MVLSLLIPKRVTGPLTSLSSLSQAKWWSGSQGSIYGLILPLPCLPRTFMYLNLELHSDIFISHSRRMPLSVYSPWTFSLHSRHSVSFWSLTNINLVWTVIFHLLQMFYPWHCFLCAHKAMWWVLWVPFHGSFPFVILPERIGFIVLWCYCRCHNILESALCWEKKHLVNIWELILFIFFPDIVFNVICLKFLLNSFPFLLDYGIFSGANSNY